MVNISLGAYVVLIIFAVIGGIDLLLWALCLLGLGVGGLAYIAYFLFCDRKEKKEKKEAEAGPDILNATENDVRLDRKVGAETV